MEALKVLEIMYLLVGVCRALREIDRGIYGEWGRIPAFFFVAIFWPLFSYRSMLRAVC